MLSRQHSHAPLDEIQFFDVPLFSCKCVKKVVKDASKPGTTKKKKKETRNRKDETGKERKKGKKQFTLQLLKISLVNTQDGHVSFCEHRGASFRVTL